LISSPTRTSLNGWLAAICRRECVRLATEARREVLLSEPDMTRLIDGRHSERDLCTETALRDRYERLYHAILALPARQRVVLVELLKRGDQSYLDLSGRLGLPVGFIGAHPAARGHPAAPRTRDSRPVGAVSGDHLQARSS
jgi:DNA-directed RNA polymerase specialized sigma24 family protein